MTLRAIVVLLVLLTGAPASARSAGHPGDTKLDAALSSRAHVPAPRVPRSTTLSRVIIRTVDGREATPLITAVGGTPGRYFPTVGGQVAIVPDTSLEWLASRPEVAGVSLDRAVSGTSERAAISSGARWVTQQLGVDGSGIGVATIDSGVTPWHDDLEGRVVHFADFVNAQTVPYDDYGHGTHVAGIIAGSGYDSGGARRGIASGAHLVVLKALDVSGNGFTSNVIAAIDYAIANRVTYNIRVLNLSVAAGVYESFTKDPLTLAAKRAVDAGIVVVAAAGNHGRSATGRAQYGGIASPGNAPWVLTVGAVSDQGTLDRRDDVVAGFSSRGPAAIDRSAKPDIVAPGVAIESTTDAGSALYSANAGSRIWGSVKTGSEPYLSLTGTSMAAPVVTGVVALMLQANPALTPNAVKAILEYTAEARDNVDHLTQGAGFLNARGAVELSRAFAADTSPAPSADSARWNRHIIWGNLRIGGAMLRVRSAAWTPGVAWGALQTPDGQPIGWNFTCASGATCDAIPSATPCDVVTGDCATTLQPPGDLFELLDSDGSSGAGG